MPLKGEDRARYNREYYESHRDEIRAYHSHPDRRVRKRETFKARCLGLKNAVFEKLGGRCSNSRCMWVNEDGSRGCTDRRCLQIDHGYRQWGKL